MSDLISMLSAQEVIVEHKEEYVIMHIGGLVYKIPNEIYEKLKNNKNA